MKKILHGALAAATIAWLASCGKEPSHRQVQEVQWATSALVVEKLDTPVAPPEPITFQFPISPEHQNVHPEIVAWFGSLINTLWIWGNMWVSTLHRDQKYHDVRKTITPSIPSHDIRPVEIMADLKTVEVDGHIFRLTHSTQTVTDSMSAKTLLNNIWNKDVTLTWTLEDYSSETPPIRGEGALELGLRLKAVVAHGPTYRLNWTLEEDSK